MTKSKLNLERTVNFLGFVDIIHILKDIIVFSKAVKVVFLIGIVFDFIIVCVPMFMFIEQLLELILIHWNITPDSIIVGLELVIRLVILKEPSKFIVCRLWLERLGFWLKLWKLVPKGISKLFVLGFNIEYIIHIAIIVNWHRW